MKQERVKQSKQFLFVVCLVLETLLATGLSLSFGLDASATDEADQVKTGTGGSCFQTMGGNARPRLANQILEPLSAADGKFPNFPIAKTPPVLSDSGLWSFTIDWNNKEKEIELPSILSDHLRADPNLRIIVLAGNTLYEHTRHNLGFHFGDYLIEHAGAVGATQDAQSPKDQKRYQVFERLDIVYDDRTTRSEYRWLYSEPGTFRTPQMEIFIIESPNAHRVAILRPIGDYNEIGDVLAPVLDLTGVPIHRVLLVHDDLRETESSLTFYDGPHDPKGNNAVFSINRALSFKIISEVMARVKENPVFGRVLDALEFDLMRAKLNDLASLREGSTALRNLNTILIAVRSSLRKLVQDRASRLILDQLVGDQLRVLKRAEAEMRRQPLSDNFAIRSAQQSDLISLQVDIRETERRLAREKERLNTAYQELDREIERIVREGLSFNRLAIGTGAPEGLNNFVDFVLGNFPPEKFDTNFWELTWKKVSEYLQQLK